MCVREREREREGGREGEKVKEIVRVRESQEEKVRKII